MVLCVLLSDVPHPPLIFSAPVTNKPNFEAHYKLLQWRQVTPSAPNASLSEQKAQETWQFHPPLSPLPIPPALYLFHRPSVPVSLLKEHTASLYTVFPSVAVACCSLPASPSPSQPPPMVFVYISVCTKWTMKKTCTAFCQLTVFILSCLLPLAVFTPLPPYMLISGQWIWIIVLRGTISCEKALTHPPLKMALKLEHTKKEEGKKKENMERRKINCLIRALGRSW